MNKLILYLQELENKNKISPILAEGRKQQRAEGKYRPEKEEKRSREEFFFLNKHN